MPAEIVRQRLPFPAQIEFFRRKLNLPSERWDSIEKAAHDRGFIVAGAQAADLLSDLRRAVDDVIAGGDTLADFRRNFRSIVADRGWHGWTGEGSKAGEAWRTKVIYQTNIASSYAAGRWAQLTDPKLLAVRPYWRYIHNDSALNPRPQHQAWGREGLTLRHDHPFWRTHFPPNGWGCRCRVKAVRGPAEGDATEPPAGWDERNARGLLPGIDRGWDYAPGANAATPLRQMIDAKLIKLDAPIGAAMVAALKPALALERRLAWADMLDAWRATGQVGATRTQVVGAIAPDTLDWLRSEKAIQPVSAEIGVQDRLVLGPKERRHQKAGDGLTDAEWRQLPALLDDPDRILYDTKSGHLLFIGEAGGAAEKLTVEFDYLTKKQPGESINLIVSAYRQRLADIEGEIKGGLWQVVK